jgi:hypothetical protein
MFNKLKILSKMKIKNMKLMLLSLFGLMGASNASAAVTAVGEKQKVDGVMYEVKAGDVKQDEKGRSVNGVNYDLYTIKWTALEGSKSFETKEAYVIGVNAAASDADVATIAIPAEVKGDKGDYKVVEISEGWYSASKMKDVTAKTTSLSLDVTNLKAALAPEAYKTFSKLTALTIIDASTGTPVVSSFDGSTCAFKGTLTTLDLTKSRISEIADNGLAGYTALTGFDFGTNIKKVGASAFEGDYGITTLTIPATVTAIGDDAFKDMYKAKDGDTPAKGLTTLTINGANNTYDGDGKLTGSVIPAAFKGNAKLNSVTVGSTTATKIAENAFAASATNAAAPIKVIDLSGATALATIAGAFPAGLALQSVKLYGSNMATLAQTDLDLSASQLSLTEITLPKKLNTLSQLFTNFLYLKELDLSVTDVKAIPEDLFYISPRSLQNIRHKKDPSAQFKDADGYAYSSKNMNEYTAIWIDPALTTVKLNAETENIGARAFNGCVALATVTGLNQPKLQSIGRYAFNGTALPTLDLSAATNDDETNGFFVIPAYAFGNIPTLTGITLPAQINEIATGAFANDGAVTSINLQDLRGLKDLYPIFHDGVVNQTYDTHYSYTDPVTGETHEWDETRTTKYPETVIPVTTLTLPDGLLWIEPGALQLLDIAEITIPASVRYVGAYALQGCIKLEKFTWNDAKYRYLCDNTFRGDDHLKEVKMVTKTPGSTITIYSTRYSIADKSVDVIFKGNKKDELTFTVNAEDYASFVAAGWSETNLHYCTLSCENASVYPFKPESQVGEYYYSNYYNGDQATWFPVENFEVFGAQVQNANVVMLPATEEEGYFKVAKGEACIIRSKMPEAEYELKNASFNDISTMPTDNELIWGKNVIPSRLSYQYKLGIKGGKVAFYRIVSGKINGVYIQAATPKDRLDIVFDGEATAINGVATKAAENNGAIYNLQGVRVNKAQKGLYIQNGKKYIMK